jgi:hypothetical protein
MPCLSRAKHVFCVPDAFAGPASRRAVEESLCFRVSALNVFLKLRVLLIPLSGATLPRMKKTSIFLFVVVALLATSVLAAVDLTGTWNCKVVLGEQSGTPTFVLKQQGEKLTGTYSGALGDAPITGTVKGSDVTIDFEASGAQIHYAGKVDKDGKKIEGTCDYGGQASGTFLATKKESK